MELQVLLEMKTLGQAEAYFWQVLLPKWRGGLEPLMHAWDLLVAASASQNQQPS